jgi:hypothetical protein
VAYDNANCQPTLGDTANCSSFATLRPFWIGAKIFWHIHNGPKGFQKLFSLPFLVAFVGLSLHFCSQRSSFAFSKTFRPILDVPKNFPALSEWTNFLHLLQMSCNL